ncbi:glutathione S-transferase [Xylona heveae TC161]|uniref:glutathione transferase n=1 Tax=Xylona heveae (strain CBS 132557 / TC161) TaxID=1328760 RepID=A0A161TDK8_XYLHT|nr:glutathione S-transferase [Xylona heveae TC161]KZF23957.1 glutathione S-transferase [Xylona heveae TC161]
MASQAPAEHNFKLTLHWLNQSRSQRIVWLLEELKLPYEVKLYERNKDYLAPPELKEVHPLGKSPVIVLEAPALSKPLVLAESGTIVEYLTEHFGQWLAPKQYAPGKEGQLGGETEEWLRYRYFMHYTEGSLMAIMVVWVIIQKIKNAPVPFFIKPITNMIGGNVEKSFTQPNFDNHFALIESQLNTSPNGGDFICGKELTGADILMIFPLESAVNRGVITQDKYPKICDYVSKIQQREAYQRASQKIKEIEGSDKTSKI